MVLGDASVLRSPVPCAGSLGIFDVPTRVEAAVLAAGLLRVSE